MRCQSLALRDTCPASDVTVAQQSQSSDITSPPRMPQVGENVFQGQFKSLIGVHVRSRDSSSFDRCRRGLLGSLVVRGCCCWRELWSKWRRL